MKNPKAAPKSLLVALLFYVGASTGMATERPTILIGESKAVISEKIANNAWAQTVYNSILQSVEPYVEQHKTDPDWIVSRLQMHWNTHYERTFVNGQIWSHGEGRAPVPTVRFAGGRDWTVPYARPKLALSNMPPLATRTYWGEPVSLLIQYQEMHINATIRLNQEKSCWLICIFKRCEFDKKHLINLNSQK